MAAIQGVDIGEEGDEPQKETAEEVFNRAMKGESKWSTPEESSPEGSEKKFAMMAMQYETYE